MDVYNRAVSAGGAAVIGLGRTFNSVLWEGSGGKEQGGCLEEVVSHLRPDTEWN